MKKLLSLALLCTAFVIGVQAQDGGGKKKKKAEKKHAASVTESVDTTSNGNRGSIDEPGTVRGKDKKNTVVNDSTKTEQSPSPSPVPTTEVESPKEETPQATQNPAEPAKSDEAPAPPGAGSLDDSGSGTSLTIDEAGSQRVKTPVTPPKAADVIPQNLAIDEAGSQKVKTTVNNATNGASAPTKLTIDEPGSQKVKVTPNNLEGGSDSLKTNAAGKLFDLIIPKK